MADQSKAKTEEGPNSGLLVKPAWENSVPTKIQPLWLPNSDPPFFFFSLFPFYAFPNFSYITTEAKENPFLQAKLDSTALLYTIQLWVMVYTIYW